MFGFAKRSLRSHPRINPSTQPSDVARGSRSKAVLELTLIVLSGEKRMRAAFVFCGSQPAGDGGLRADQFPADCMRSLWERAWSGRRSDESGLPEHSKGTVKHPAFWRINVILQARLKYTNRYAIRATTPCVVAYAYARIRRLTQLGEGYIVSLSLKSDWVW